MNVLAEAQVSSQDSVPALAGFIASSFSPLVAEVARRCLSGVTPNPATAIVIVSPDGDVETARAAASGGRVSPLLFFQAVPNAIAGYIAAKWDLRGPVVCLEEPGIEGGVEVARIIIRDGDADEALVVFVGDGARAVLVRGVRP
ncbi:hypothetical protein [Allorhizocola rhizosphaerae]|uniref:hypothetical protein n=1 Tax=Allorhizocola rhizosphaerae TaxID=1872709 RepID=UPI000E3D87A9|nr:hypothetical protein [Allorhizocola rhizosphaerae]